MLFSPEKSRVAALESLFLSFTYLLRVFQLSVVSMFAYAASHLKFLNNSEIQALLSVSNLLKVTIALKKWSKILTGSSYLYTVSGSQTPAPSACVRITWMTCESTDD